MDAPTRIRATTASAAASGRGSIPTTSRAGGWSARRSRRRTRRRCARRRSSSRARRRRATLRRARGTRAARAPPPRPPTPPRSLPRSKPPRPHAAARAGGAASLDALRHAVAGAAGGGGARRASPVGARARRLRNLAAARRDAPRQVRRARHLGLPPLLFARRLSTCSTASSLRLLRGGGGDADGPAAVLARWRGAQYGGGAFVDGESTDALALRLTPGAPPTRLACLA